MLRLVKTLEKLSIIALICVTFFACKSGNQNNQDDSTKKESPSEVVESETSQSVDYKVSFRNDKGEITDLSSLKGKVVFINFWATWCPPCIEELPSIDKLRQTLKNNDKIVFLMVDVDSEIEKSTGFIKENGYDLPVFIPNSDIPNEFLAGAIPTTVILDKSGKIVSRLEGGRKYDTPEVISNLESLATE